VTRANFGSGAHLRATADGMVVWGSGDEQILENGALRPAKEKWAAEIPREAGPFAISDFGAIDRLSWASGACTVRQNSKFCYWGQRYACSIYDEMLLVVDATRALVVKLTVTGLFKEARYTPDPRPHVGVLWLDDYHAVTSIDLAQLEALFDRTSGPITIEIHETYPRHKPNRIESADILEVATKAMTVRILDDMRIIAIPRVEGAETGMRIHLCDELAAGQFHAIEVPGRPRQILNEMPLTHHSLQAQLVVEPAIDPVAGLMTTVETPSRQDDLDRLFNALADDPEDAATREILIDLLEDSGEPYATLLHELLAGNDTEPKRIEALGALTNYLTKIGYHGGLWATAWLSKATPLDPTIGDAVAADHRLGFLHTLRIGEGPFAVYAKLVGSPRAVGLRHVDVPNGQVLAALIAGKRTSLTRLSNVKFATRAVIDGLADPTFDRVVQLHTETSASIVAKQLQFFIRDEAGFFARAPRHLILTERDGFGDRLEQPVNDVWRDLPVAAITVGALTLKR
jgi:hypothetical protein